MFVLYFILWVIFNGNITLEIIIFGVVIATLLLTFACRLTNYSLSKEKKLYRNVFRLLRYAFVLVKEIVKANFAVIHLILSGEEEPVPAVVEFESDLKSDFTKAFLANAITLTPGTITVMLEGNTYTVHCLDDTFAEGMNESRFIEMLSEIDNN